jgi:hypothetical protein
VTRPVLTFVAIIAAAALLAPTLAPLVGGALIFWGAVAAAALASALLLSPRRRREPGASSFLKSGRFLCDRCRYDSPRDCSRPERPNATRCDDFRSR